MQAELRTVRIEKLVFPRWGLARDHGWVVFVDGGLPEEQVVVKITKRRASFAHGHVVEVLSPSPWRRCPPCPVFGECGGCSWLHIQPEAQLRFRREMLGEVFQRAGFSSEIVNDLLGASRYEFFRNKSAYSTCQHRGAPTCGFHQHGSADVVVSARHCILQSEHAQQIVRRVEEFMARHDRSTWPRRVTVREGKRTGDRMVHWSGPDVLGSHPEWRSAFESLATTLVGEGPGRGPVVVVGPGTIRERMCGHTYTIGPHDFFQTNTAVAEIMFDWIAARIAQEPPGQVVEFYAGSAALSLVLAPYAREILAIESERSAVEVAKLNLATAAVGNVRILHARAEVVAPTCLRTGADWVIVDPPRTGLSAALRRVLCAVRPRRFVYISCDPATLVRDLRELTVAGLHIEVVQPFDMFPNSHHVEIVVVGGWPG